MSLTSILTKTTLSASACHISSISVPLSMMLSRAFSTGIRYTPEHEWIKVEGGVGTVGLSDHAQKELGDVVYVDLPNIGDMVDKGSTLCSVESVKAASDIYSPVSGKIVGTNGSLRDTPNLINMSPEQNGWVARVSLSDPAELDALMDSGAYQQYCKDQAH